MSDAPETVRILRFASGGNGVGRLADGRTVFVPRTAPGDLVVLRDVRRRRTFAEAEVARVAEPSADRVAPPCAHFDADDCGGCTLQHVGPAAQLAAKAQTVRDALERIGRLEVPEFEVVANPRPLRWRSRVAFTVDVRTGAAGLRRRGRPGEVVDVVTCLLATDGVRRLWEALRPRRDAFPAGTERITLREDRGGGLHVVAHGPAEWRAAAEADVALAAAGVRATLWIQPEGRAARVAGGAAPSQAATFFEQVDASMGDVVRRHAVAAAGDVAGRRAWDLYAGIGETTALLAAAGAAVESVEADEGAVAEAERRGPSAGVVRHAARVEDVLERLGDPDVVVANPPRAGFAPGLTTEIAARGARHVVYVSCDPATLARDLRAMSGTFALASLRAFDSFPQTAHVETVAALTRR